MRVAVVSGVLPPTWSGQSMMLARLLRGFDATSYVLVRTMPAAGGGDYVEPLPATTHELGSAFLPFPWTTPRLAAANVRRFGAAIWQRSRALERILRDERCGTVVACTGGDMLDVPASYAAAKRTGARLVPYYFDHWSQQSLGGPMLRRVAEAAERYILPRADTVLVPNEFLARELEAAHRARTAIVRNATEVPDRALRSRGVDTPASVVYTGAVYAANADAFRNLVAALASVERRARVHVYTAQSRDELATAGINGALEVHPHLPAHEMPRIHADADILFLPLAFESPYPSLIRTSSPAKLGEYLASGAPILVHAPPDCFVSWYVRRHECGVVVDELAPEPLAAAAVRLLEDDDLRRRVATRAVARARADFDVSLARRAFALTVGLPL